MNIWREYSLSFIKNNKGTSISIMVAALISSLLLSLTCGVFYNMWTDEVRLIKLEEGDWQGKLVGDLTSEDIETIECYPNVKKVVLTDSQTDNVQTANLYFNYPRSIYKDLPLITNQIGIDTTEGSSALQYHDKLLSQYFIFSPEKGSSPQIILFVYLFTMLLACLSLILIIHNAFGVSMNARLHQLGLLQSIGASPRGIRAVLTNEAVALCLLPILIGTATGAGLCYALLLLVMKLVGSVRKYDLLFDYHPYIFMIALIAALLTVWLSARIPANKISKINPLEAIKYGEEPIVQKDKHFFLFSHLFGIEGELARKSLFLRRKAFRTSAFSLTISAFVFCGFMNMEAISNISTKMTFFERFKDSWDLMVTITDSQDPPEELLYDIREMPEVKECISYQIVTAYTKVSKAELSDELLSLGGLEGLKDVPVKYSEDRYVLEVPLLILDDESYKMYYATINTSSKPSSNSVIDGAVLVNTIWDNVNSNRRYKSIIPFVKAETLDSLEFYTIAPESDTPSTSFELGITATAVHTPQIREEFPNFSLLMIISDSTYQTSAIQPAVIEYQYSILSTSEKNDSVIEGKLTTLLDSQYKYTLESKQATVQFNTSVRNAYKLVIGGMAGLLVCIGLTNVFSNSIGHLYQRKKEFARYISLGLSPSGVKKVLYLEAMILGLKPILISLLLNIPLVIFALNKSLIKPSEYLEQMPLLPILTFAFIIILAVGFAYYLGGRKICRLRLVDTLKDNTMI